MSLLGRLNAVDTVRNCVREARIAFTRVPNPEKWVFLVGCYNSGTTLLAELLGRHPQISALPTEGHFLTDQFPKDYEVGLPRMWANNESLFRLTEHDVGPDVRRIKKQWGFRFDLTKPVLLEKSPPNTPRTRWLQANFSPAYFVAIVRNGYAVSEGITRKANPKHLPEGWPIEQSAWQWRRSNEVLEADSENLQRLIWLRYEDLTAHTLRELNRICDFLDIQRFQAFDISQSFAIHERDQAVRDLNGDSIARLSRTEIERINGVASDCLRRFGYEVLSGD